MLQHVSVLASRRLWESDIVVEADSRRDARFVLLGIGLGMASVLCLFIVSVPLSLLLDSLTRRPPHIFLSPDGAHRAVITEKRFGIIDPPVELWINLEDITTGAVVDQVIVGIDEASDVGHPSAVWSAEAVVVNHLEQEHNISATLRRTRRR